MLTESSEAETKISKLQRWEEQQEHVGAHKEHLMW